MAEQAGQKALKAFLLFKGERYITKHSVAELIKSIIKYDRDFNSLIEYGYKLDQYYIPTRYPDALALGAVPYRSYSKEQAEEAVKFSEEILKLVKEKIRGEKWNLN
jgi:HEPN domain-containing protein